MLSVFRYSLLHYPAVLQSLSQGIFKPLTLGFSAKTTANMTQDIIDGKLDKRQKGDEHYILPLPPRHDVMLSTVDEMELVTHNPTVTLTYTFSPLTPRPLSLFQSPALCVTLHIGVYGPPVGQTAIIFVDDLNMPEVETYGAQPPLELLRQMIDNKGW